MAWPRRTTVITSFLDLVSRLFDFVITSVARDLLSSRITTTYPPRLGQADYTAQDLWRRHREQIPRPLVVTSPLCYSRRVAKKATAKPSITIVGPGNLGSALAIELYRAGYPISAIVRRSTSKITRPKALARRVKAELVILGERPLETDIVWLTVPDDAIAERGSRNSRHRSRGRARSSFIPAERSPAKNSRRSGKKAPGWLPSIR